MKVKDFFEWSESMQKEENRLMKVKGEEYTVSDEDKFKNFNSIGERMSLMPEQVCLIYLLKHMDSITNYVNKGTEYSDEKIEGRISDAIQYLLLLVTLITDEKQKSKGVQNDPEC